MVFNKQKKYSSSSRKVGKAAYSSLIALAVMTASLQISTAHLASRSKRITGLNQVHSHFDLSNPEDSIFDASVLAGMEGVEQLSPSSNKRNRSRRISPQALVVLTVTNTDDAGLGSLRAALTIANADGMPNNIVFNIPVTDPQFNGTVFTILPKTPLPNLDSGETFIDGVSQTIFTGNTNAAGPEVVLNGTLQFPINNGGIRIFSANNRISGLVINGFDGPGGDGIRMAGPAATNNFVTGCYIGTNSAGSSTVPNKGQGVSIILGSNGNRIGGIVVADRNVISGNENGINIVGSPTSTAGENIIRGNYIGTNATGTAALGNTANGIGILGTNENEIGGIVPGAGNLSSGNGQNGLRIAGLQFDTNPDPAVTTFDVNPSTGNVVQGNRIGTNAAGTAALQNGVDGVRLNHGAQDNMIGGIAAGAANICSGNFSHGVHLDGFRALTVPYTPVQDNTVQGNLLGTDVTGLLPVPNQLAGVIIFGAIDNLIGGAASGQGNVIAFNTGGSVPDGLGGSIIVPGAGVSISTLPEVPGAEIANDPTTGNRISGNSIHSNTGVIDGDGLGIDLNEKPLAIDSLDGVTPNDVGDADSGANMLQNFPVLVSVSTTAGTTTIQGTLNSLPNTTFSVEFFSNTVADPTGFGEGETFIGRRAVTTNGAGNASFSASFPRVGCASVTSTATDPAGNTSEFSNAVDEAPVVVCNVRSRTLWPPNHNLINVGFSAIVTDNCPNPVTLVQVFSDEDDQEETGEGNHSPDAKDIGVGTLRLRSERKGNGDGRVYLVIVSATDSFGNTTTCCSTVTVSHSQSKKDKNRVAAQAAAAAAHCAQFGTPPPGYFVVGDGPVIGPKQ